jgi:alpha-beta hydrolase superfamily lysophospholipase
MELPSLTDLDRWLDERERRVPGIKPGVAAGVVWALPGRAVRTPLALVYLHGYTATRGEIAPVPENLARTLGANLFYARLTGHGVGPDGHRTCTAADWVRDAREAWAIGGLLGERVILMATSTGGTLAILQVLGPEAAVPAATILVSPNLGPKRRSSEFLRLPGREWLLKKLVGDSVSFVPENETVSRYWDCTHHSHSLIPMMDLVGQARRRNFRRWPTPVLVVFDPGDETVEERITARKFATCPEATVMTWKTAPGDHNHVLAGDALSPSGTVRMTDLVLEFLGRVLG